MTQTLVLPVKPISWNKLVHKHYRTHIELARSWKTTTRIEARKAEIKKIPIGHKVHLTFMAHWTTKRHHDIDSLYLKPITDGLVEEGILVDDNIEIVTKVTSMGEIDCKEDELIITIYDYKE